MTLPTLEILGDRRPAPSAELVPLLVCLRAWCTPRAPQPGTRPDARLAVSTEAPKLSSVIDDDVPLAIIVEPGDVIDHDLATRALVLLVRAEDPRRALPSALVLPREWVDAGAHPPLSPFVRARWRAHLGLPADLRVTLGFHPETPVGAMATPTMLALTATAAVRGPATLLALALGTPTVTDAHTAQRLGAVPDEHVLVAEESAVRDTAAELVDDDRRAAALSRACVDVARRHDLGRVARILATRLGLGPAVPPAAPLAGLQLRLDELHTPPGARPAVRALTHVAPLCGRRDWADLTGRRR